MAQLVASMSGVVLGGVVEVVGSNFARGKIFTASIGSVDSLYPSVYIYIYIYIYIYKISLSQTNSPLASKKIAQRHVPAFDERSDSVQYVALGFHPS